MPASTASDVHPAQRTRPGLVFALAAVLVGFAIWSIVLFVRHQSLGLELSQMRGWSARVAEIQRAFEAGGDLAGTNGERALWQDLEAHTDTGLQLAARKAMLAEAQWASATDDDQRWQAAASAAGAAGDVQTLLQERIGSLAAALGVHGRTLTTLVIGVLLLASSNLWLLMLAHRRRRALEAAHAEALARTENDPLTGLLHRDAIVEVVRRELARGTRAGQPVAVVLAEIERFDEIEATLRVDGTAAVLRAVGDRIRAQLRPYDAVGRRGGARFLVVLPGCDRAGSEGVTTRLEAEVAGRPFDHDAGPQRLRLRSVSRIIEPGGADVALLLDDLGRRFDAG